MLAPVVLLLAFAMHFGKPQDKPAGARTPSFPALSWPLRYSPR
jgi:hypothetical protein